VDKEPKKRTRVELTPNPRKEPREQTGEEVEAPELRVDELEPRVTPKQIGTFF